MQVRFRSATLLFALTFSFAGLGFAYDRDYLYWPELEGERFEIRVVDELGVAVPTAVVSFSFSNRITVRSPSSRRAWNPYAVAHADRGFVDRNGVLELEIMRTDWAGWGAPVLAFRIDAPGYASTHLAISDSLLEKRVFEVRLLPKRFGLQGRVDNLPSGRKMPLVVVASAISTWQTKRGPVRPRVWARRICAVDSDGGFRFADLPSGRIHFALLAQADFLRLGKPSRFSIFYEDIPHWGNLGDIEIDLSLGKGPESIAIEFRSEIVPVRIVDKMGNPELRAYLTVRRNDSATRHYPDLDGIVYLQLFEPAPRVPVDSGRRPSVSVTTVEGEGKSTPSPFYLMRSLFDLQAYDRSVRGWKRLNDDERSKTRPPQLTDFIDPRQRFPVELVAPGLGPRPIPTATPHYNPS